MQSPVTQQAVSASSHSDPTDPSDVAFWARAEAVASTAAQQHFDNDMAQAFVGDYQSEAPADRWLPYFWGRAALIVKIEHHMAAIGVTERDLHNIVALAQDMHDQLAWLAHPGAKSQKAMACQKLHADIMDALTQRQYHPTIVDQTYGGKLPAPRRIKLVKG